MCVLSLIQLDVSETELVLSKMEFYLRQTAFDLREF